MHPKRRQQPQKLLKWPKYHWSLKNKENTLITSKNDQNTPKLSQNTLDFLDYGGILVGFKFLLSFSRILAHFAHFSNVEVYILIILDVWGILAVYEVSGFDSSF